MAQARRVWASEYFSFPRFQFYAVPTRKPEHKTPFLWASILLHAFTEAVMEAHRTTNSVVVQGNRQQHRLPNALPEKKALKILNSTKFRKKIWCLFTCPRAHPFGFPGVLVCWSCLCSAFQQHASSLLTSNIILSTMRAMAFCEVELLLLILELLAFCGPVRSVRSISSLINYVKL